MIVVAVFEWETKTNKRAVTDWGLFYEFCWDSNISNRLKPAWIYYFLGKKEEKERKKERAKKESLTRSGEGIWMKPRTCSNTWFCSTMSWNYRCLALLNINYQQQIIFSHKQKAIFAQQIIVIFCGVKENKGVKRWWGMRTKMLENKFERKTQRFSRFEFCCGVFTFHIVLCWISYELVMIVGGKKSSFFWGRLRISF